MLRDRESVSGGRGRERKRETHKPAQAPGSELSTQSPTRGLDPTHGEITTRAETKSQTLNRPSHPVEALPSARTPTTVQAASPRHVPPED